MTWITETPWPTIAIGAALIGLLLVALINTGQRALIKAMLGVAAVVLLLVLVEWLVVTDREEIGATLERAAVALETNDVNNVLALMAPNASQIRSIAQARLPLVEISDANIGGDLEVKINQLTSPPTARAQFTARITGKGRAPGEAFPYDNFVRRIALKLRKTESGWLLTEYEEQSDMREAIDPRD